MSVEITVPAVGESINSGILSVWHKKDGETVTAGEVLFTLETDKVSTEVNAPEGGMLKTRAAEGDEVKVGQVVATLEPAGATPAAKPVESVPKKAPARAAAPESGANTPVPAPAAEPVVPKAAPKPAPKAEAPAPKPRISG